MTGYSVWNLTTLPTELTYHPTCLDLEPQFIYIDHPPQSPLYLDHPPIHSFLHQSIQFKVDTMAPTMVGQYDEAAASAILEPISVSLHVASYTPLNSIALYVGMPVCHCGAGHLLRVNPLSFTCMHTRSWTSGVFNMMVLQYFLYQKGDKTWIKLLVAYLCVSPLQSYQVSS